MTITINGKRKNSLEIFPKIEDFIDLLKNEYNRINFENENIKSLISLIYQQILYDDGNIRYLRFSRWLPSKFGFKFKNKFTLGYWLERGFTEEDYNRCIKEKSENTKKTQTDFRKKQLVEKSKFNPNYSIKFRLKSTFFTSDILPICNECGSNLLIKSSSYLNEPIYKIIGCSNLECITNNTKIRDIIWRAYLPIEKYNELKHNLKSVKRSFSKEFWMNKGYTEQDAIDKVFDIQSKNSKKFIGKRTGKDKKVLKEKGYTDEEIRKTCLTMCNIEYWLDRGYDEDDAKVRVFEHQSYASKHIDYDKRLLPSNKEYWLNRGFSENESLQKVKESQTTFSKEICIKKHGYEKGLEVFKNRNKKWQNSLLKNGNIKGGYSKISQELFMYLYNILNGNFNFATLNGEYCIYENERNYYYDFICNETKKIIEYNGDQYHANPKIYNESDLPHPYYKKVGYTAKDIWLNDEIKNNVAINKGHEVLIIWDSEYKLNKELIIQKCINFLTNNK